MASAEEETAAAARDLMWHCIGPVSELSSRQCRLIYSTLGYHSDVCLFHVKGEFFALDARCSHSGGPLCDGDIEEADGVLKVFCPWHDYDFNIKTGGSSTGLQQRVHEVKVEGGSVFVRHTGLLSLKPFPTEQLKKEKKQPGLPDEA